MFFIEKKGIVIIRLFFVQYAIPRVIRGIAGSDK